MRPDLAVRFGPLTLKNPVVCASGEHVLTAAGIRAGLAAGASVVVAKSVNETQAARDQLARTDYALMGDDWRRARWPGDDWAQASLLCRSGLQPMATDAWIENAIREANDSSNPGLPRLALKMATGSGKTVVMAMLIVSAPGRIGCAAVCGVWSGARPSRGHWSRRAVHAPGR